MLQCACHLYDLHICSLISSHRKEYRVLKLKFLLLVSRKKVATPFTAYKCLYVIPFGNNDAVCCVQKLGDANSSEDTLMYIKQKAMLSVSKVVMQKQEVKVEVVYTPAIARNCICSSLHFHTRTLPCAT